MDKTIPVPTASHPTLLVSRLKVSAKTPPANVRTEPGGTNVSQPTIAKDNIAAQKINSGNQQRKTNKLNQRPHLYFLVVQGCTLGLLS